MGVFFLEPLSTEILCHFFIFSVTRQMKTITYSLASTKCMEEGWTVRPPSPSLTDNEQVQDPFVIEVNPLQLVSISIWRNFQLNVERNSMLQWFYFTTHCDWSRKLSATFSTNQMWPGHLCFPAFRAVCFFLWVLIGSLWLAVVQTLVKSKAHDRPDEEIREKNWW